MRETVIPVFPNLVYCINPPYACVLLRSLHQNGGRGQDAAIRVPPSYRLWYCERSLKRGGGP
jgi:hypothetical protein